MQNATKRVDAATFQQIAPDVPEIPAAVREAAAQEMEADKAPALTYIVGACYVTRAQSRALHAIKK